MACACGQHQTKACGRHGCETVIAGPSSLVSRRIYCSQSCAIRARMAAGWKPETFLTAEARSRGARRGGASSGEKRHKAAMARAVKDCADLMPEKFTDGLSASQLACVKVLIARSYLRAETRMRQRFDTNARYWRQKAERKRQAGEAA